MNPFGGAGFRNHPPDVKCSDCHSISGSLYILHLVGGIPTPLKNMSSSVGVTIPNQIEKINKCSKPPIRYILHLYENLRLYAHILMYIYICIYLYRSSGLCI